DYAENSRAALFEYGVHAWEAQNLRRVRRLAAQVPTREPVRLDEVRDWLGRRKPLQVELGADVAWTQDAARAVDHVAFLQDPGRCWRLRLRQYEHTCDQQSGYQVLE